MRIAFAGTPPFAAHILEALIERQQVVAVYGQPPRPAGRGRRIAACAVESVARAHALPVESPSTLRTSDASTILSRYSPDLMIVAAYGLILPPAILRAPRLGCVNVHASLLPRWRGAAPIERAMIAGDATTGITIIAMDEGLDTGPMLAVAPCDIADTDTGGSLSDRLAVLGARVMLDCLERWPTLVPTPQPAAGASYAKKLETPDALIDWNANAATVARTIRALNPRLPAHGWLGPDRVRFLMARVAAAGGRRGAPGEILGLNKQALTVATGLGSIEITLLQLARGKGIPIDAAALYSGFRGAFAVGRKFSNRPGDIGVA